MEALRFETRHTTEAQRAQRECGGLLYVAGTGGRGVPRMGEMDDRMGEMDDGGAVGVEGCGRGGAPHSC